MNYTKDRLFVDTSKNQRCRVLYKVEDIAICLVKYVKFWDDWEVDRYGNANLDLYDELVLPQYAVSIKKIRRIRAYTSPDATKDSSPIHYCVKIEEAMTRVMTELILRECMEKAQAESSLAKPKINNNVKIELSKEHLNKLQNNAYSETDEEDVVAHIAKVLEISNLIKTPNMETDQLRVEDEDKEDGYLEFIIWLNSKCKDHKSMDGMTKNALWHHWLKEKGNNELMDDVESNDEERKEFDYENPRNIDADTFFKPYLDAQEKDNIYEIEKKSERNQKNRGGNISKENDIVLNSTPDFDNIKVYQLNERVCKAEKFEVIKRFSKKGRRMDRDMHHGVKKEPEEKSNLKT
ncbi:hypothetical protein Tco_0265080 [Tanacetum coccineum]